MNEDNPPFSPQHLSDDMRRIDATLTTARQTQRALAALLERGYWNDALYNQLVVANDRAAADLAKVDAALNELARDQERDHAARLLAALNHRTALA